MKIDQFENLIMKNAKEIVKEKYGQIADQNNLKVIHVAVVHHVAEMVLIILFSVKVMTKWMDIIRMQILDLVWYTN